jgi:acetylornithine deacetylase
MGDVEGRLAEAVATLAPKYTALLQRLVRIPSPIGDEAAAQTEVAHVMREIGLDTDVFDVDPSSLQRVTGFRPVSRSYAGRPCVVGVLRGGGGGRSLALNAHVDTAPVDPGGVWTRGPYSGEIDATLLYGRGAWDDKAGIVEMLLVAEAFKSAGIRLRGDLVIKSVIDDEAAGNGTLACLARGYRTDGAVIVDGTWPERFIVSHLGQLWFKVTITGRSAPASVASRGANPVEGVGAVIAALKQVVARRNASATRWGTQAEPAFINVGAAAGGVWPGAVPVTCELAGQFGFAPPDTPQTARTALIDAVTQLSLAPEWPSGLRVTISFDGLETPVVIGDPGNSIVKAIAAAAMRLHGRPISESVISGHCDLRHYYSAAIPACLYGPGGGKNAHAEDEYFELAHLPMVARTLAATALEWCH